MSYLGYSANNKYNDFPPLMNDGRAVVASYQPESTINNEIIVSNNIKSNWEYRRYLQNNAMEIMDKNFKEACNDTGAYAKVYDLTTSEEVVKGITNQPFLYDINNAEIKPFGYASSDLKTSYLSREELSQNKGISL
jgi:hypothetical protein